MKEKTRAELFAMYNKVGPFSEGLAWARKNGEWFHIRPDGTPAYEQRFDNVCAFSGGSALVLKDGRRFRIYPDGTPVVDE